MTKTFVITAGNWSGNIGNSFFNYGTRYVLRQAVKDARVEFLSDQAAYLNIFPFRYRHEPKNSLRYNDYIRPDYLVLQGSLLTKQFPTVWKSSLQLLKEAGVKTLLIGVGQFEYDDEEVSICRKLLQECKPYVFISRDSRTFENFHDLAEYSYDGIDSAYFLPDVYRPLPHCLPRYIVLNFDKTPEPSISIGQEFSQREVGFERAVARFNFKNKGWQLLFPKTRLKLSKRLGKAFNFIVGPLGLSGTNQENVDGLKVVRTDHQINPIMLWRIFRGPNSFGSDIPETYLNLYSQTQLTLSDRVHAVLVTLAYGRPAMLFTASGRARIIERMGISNLSKEPVQVSQEQLVREKQAEIDFLKSVPL